MSQAADEAIIRTRQVIAFTLDAEEYAVPISQVKEVVEVTRLTPVPGTQAFILGIMNLRGKIIPILSLEKLFGLERQSDLVAEHIIVTEAADASLFGIQVDRVSEVKVIPEESVRPTPQIISSKISAEYIEGVIITPQSDADAASNPEKVFLLLDLQKIITLKVSEELNAIIADQERKVST